MKKEEKTPEKGLVKKELSLSDRFTNMVIKEFSSTAVEGGSSGLTSFHKRLCQNYFITIDGVLKKAEQGRLRKSEDYRDAVAVTWENVNMNQLALNVVAVARIGLDPSQPNHVNMIPYKNNHTKKYDIGFIIGYRGTELKAKKYDLEVPDDVVIELVFSNDVFKQIKKDLNNEIETYTFEVKDSNDRGDVIGGFYYYIFDENPRKNKLRYFTKSDIEKRKPLYASVEFWGGEKDKWKDGKKVGKEKVEGWFEEMCWKTIYRAAYNNITIDSQKIDNDFLLLKSNENEFDTNKNTVNTDNLPPEEKENVKNINIEDAVVVEEKTEEKVETKKEEKPKEEKKEAVKKEDPKEATKETPVPETQEKDGQIKAGF